MKDTTRLTLALLVAGLLAAPAGWTEDDPSLRGEQLDSPTEASKAQAREANEAAARDASRAIHAATRLELDIRLIGPTSVKIASDR